MHLQLQTACTQQCASVANVYISCNYTYNSAIIFLPACKIFGGGGGGGS
jgi:hypothetical protein